MKKLNILVYPQCAQWRFWLDCANAQANLIFAGCTCQNVAAPAFKVTAFIRQSHSILTVLVHVIIIDQCYRTAHCRNIYSRSILVSVTSECSAKRVSYKTCTGTLANSADPNQTPRNAECGVWSVRTICLNYWKLRVKWKGLKSRFPTYTQRQSTH